MRKKLGHEFIIGGGFQAQPGYKQKIVPRDYLVAFFNTKQNVDSIHTFCNNYSFSPFWIIEGLDLIAGFAAIQRKFKPTIERVLTKSALSYKEITQLNDALENVRLSVGLRKKTEELIAIDNSFNLYTIESESGRKPECDIKHHGLFDTEKSSRIVMTITPADESKWRLKKIPKGILELTNIFKSDIWETQEKYLDKVIIGSATVQYKEGGQSVQELKIELILGKTMFEMDELQASSTLIGGGETTLAKLIWDQIGCKESAAKYKRCRYCGELNAYKSQYHCGGDNCKTEHKRVAIKSRYHADPEYRKNKIENAKINKAKKVSS